MEGDEVVAGVPCKRQLSAFYRLVCLIFRDERRGFFSKIEISAKPKETERAALEGLFKDWIKTSDEWCTLFKQTPYKKTSGWPIISCRRSQNPRSGRKGKEEGSGLKKIISVDHLNTAHSYPQHLLRCRELER